MTDKKKISAKRTSSKGTDQPSLVNVDAPLPRRLRLPQQKLFRFRHMQHPVELPNVVQLTKKTCLLVWQNRGLLTGITVVYAVLSILLVHGLSTIGDAPSLKQDLLNGQIGTSLTAFTSLFASSTSSTTGAPGVYQLILAIIMTLATIWGLRQISAGERVRLKETFYKSMSPFVPFVLVLGVIILQILPFLIGGALYSFAIKYGIAVTFLEKSLWGMLFAALTIISVYMLCSSIFAMYIVTLPDMTPLRALRSARKLVQYRRLSVFRKLLYLVVALMVATIVIMVPIIVVIPLVAPWVFFLIGIVGLVVLNVYMYTLYRELLV